MIKFLSSRPLLFRGLEAALVFAALLCFLESTWDISHLMVFQHRDLERALQFTHNHWIFFGPESSGGGTLPGGYYYYLLSLPMLLGLPWEAAWHWMMVLAATAGAGMWFYGRARWGVLTMSLFIAFLTLPNGFMDSLRSFMNPGFLPIFLLAFAILSLQIFSEQNREELRTKLWIILNILLAVSLSVHFAMICIALAVWVMALKGPRWRLLPLPKRNLKWGALAFIGFLLPHIIWYSFHKAGIGIGQDLPPYIGGISKSLATIFANMWDIVYRIVFSEGDAVSDAETYFTTRAMYILTPVIFLLIIAATLVRWYENKKKPEPRFIRSASPDLYVMVILTLGAFIPASIHFVYKPGNRYVIAFAYYLAVTSALYVHKVITNEKIKYALGFVAFLAPAFGLGFSQGLKFPFRFFEYLPIYSLVIVFLVLAIALALFQEHRDSKYVLRKLPALFLMIAPVFCFSVISVSSQRQTFLKRSDTSLHMPEAEFIAKTIYSQTGWTQAEARSHIYYVQTLTSSSVSLFYETVKRKFPGLFNAPAKSTPSGFFVFRNAGANTPGVDQKTLLSSYILEKQIRQGLTENDIVIGNFVSRGRMHVVPYWVVNPQNVAHYFNNRGLNYEPSDIEERVYQLLKDSGGSVNATSTK